MRLLRHPPFGEFLAMTETLTFGTAPYLLTDRNVYPPLCGCDSARPSISEPPPVLHRFAVGSPQGATAPCYALAGASLPHSETNRTLPAPSGNPRQLNPFFLLAFVPPVC